MLAPALDAATVLERHVHVTLRGDDTVREAGHLKVRIDDADDAAALATYEIPLADNRTLERLEAYVIHPDGRRVALGAADQDTLTGAGGDFFHASWRRHQARFRDLVPGAVVVINQEVTVRPHYRTGRIPLGGGVIVDLRVVVEAAAEAFPGGLLGWRWHVEGSATGLTIRESDRGVVVHGRDLPATERPELAPDGGAVIPVLRYGWGTAGTWQDVARWYHELAASVPRAAAPVRDRARALTAGLETPRRRLDALAGFLEREVRNVAVVIGDGNYRPSPPGDVLTRKWGDCKDKAVLLVDLLRAAGIEAYPALVKKNARGRVDAAFPSPDQFNHALVAVPEGAVDHGPDDPVSGGYLFIDPTQTSGAGRWLDPDVQDQDALVVRPATAELVATPLRPDLEHRHLTVDLEVTPAGDARGRAALAIRGELADELLRATDDLEPRQLTEEVRALFARLLPGTELADVTWSVVTGGVPAMELAAAVALPDLVQGTAGQRSLRLPGMRATPDPQVLRDRRIPVVLPARSARVTWNLTLPAGWCPPAPRDDEVANAAGVFRQTVTSGGEGRMTVERRIALRRRWFEAELLPALYELALAEHRAHRRRVRLRCDGR